MFDPTVGRWTSEDDLGFAAGDANLYRYVKNTPLNATDPSGNLIYGSYTREWADWIHEKAPRLDVQETFGFLDAALDAENDVLALLRGYAPRGDFADKFIDALYSQTEDYELTGPPRPGAVPGLREIPRQKNLGRPKPRGTPVVKADTPIPKGPLTKPPVFTGDELRKAVEAEREAARIENPFDKPYVTNPAQAGPPGLPYVPKPWEWPSEKSVRMILILAEIGGGVLMLLTPTGVGQAAGSVMVLHGLDRLTTEIRKERDPKARTWTSQGIGWASKNSLSGQILGVDDKTAEEIGEWGDLIVEIVPAVVGGGHAILRLRSVGIAGRATASKASVAGDSVKPGPDKIFNLTNDIDKIRASGQVWGKTEGAVYGMDFPDARWWWTLANSKTRNPGIIVFEGQPATLFKPHPIEGPYSGIKRALGQYKAPFGDIMFDPSKASVRKLADGRIELTIREAWIGPHHGQSELWASTKFATRLFVGEPGIVIAPVGIGVVIREVILIVTEE